MRPVKQKFRHRPEDGVYGDCHRAAMASVLELDLDDVPHFFDKGVSGEEGEEAVRLFLGRHGLRAVSFALHGDLDGVLAFMQRINGDDVVWFLGGRSASACNHTVVCRGSAIVHDPSLTDAGIVGPCDDGHYWVTVLAAIAPEVLARKVAA